MAIDRGCGTGAAELSVGQLAARAGGAHRRYGPADVDRLLFIRGAQRLGLRLAEIRELIAVRDIGTCPCEPAGTLVRGHLAETDREIARFTVLRAQLAGMIDGLSGSSCPDPLPGTWRPSAVPGRREETRPPGSKNHRPATRHDVGKTVKREEPKKKAQLTDKLNNKLRAGTQGGSGPRDRRAAWVDPPLREYAARHPPEVTARARSLVARAADLPAAADLLDGLTPTLLHGDVHGANVLVQEDQATLVDWGSSRIGPAALDLANLVSAGSASVARYALIWRQVTGRPLPAGTIERGYRWAALRIPVQYLPWTAPRGRARTGGSPPRPSCRTAGVAHRRRARSRSASGRSPRAETGTSVPMMLSHALRAGPAAG